MTLAFSATGTPYFTGPTVIPLVRPQSVAADLGWRTRLHQEFLAPLGFTDDYFESAGTIDDPTAQSAAVVKLAGQLCYMSFGPNRTKWGARQKYIDNLIEQGHESVLEHAQFTFLFFGISRSLTHELVRHRHLGFSQLSQRYVDGSMLRFVERPEFAARPELHDRFLQRIDRTRAEYEDIAAQLLATTDFTEGMRQAEKRKAVNQAARAILPNETEAPIVVSGNIRAFRWVLRQRSSKAAEPEIRTLSNLLLGELKQLAPEFWLDLPWTKAP